jgi:hypothetical protein
LLRKIEGVDGVRVDRHITPLRNGRAADHVLNKSPARRGAVEFIGPSPTGVPIVRG